MHFLYIPIYNTGSLYTLLALKSLMQIVCLLLIQLIQNIHQPTRRAKLHPVRRLIIRTFRNPPHPQQQGYPYQYAQPFLNQAAPPPYEPSVAAPPSDSQATHQTIVITQQPVASNVRIQPADHEENYKGAATAALVLSIITCALCGGSLIFLSCVLPALIGAVISLGQRGRNQKRNAIKYYCDYVHSYILGYHSWILLLFVHCWTKMKL